MKRIIALACFTALICLMCFNIPAHAATGVNISGSRISGGFEASKWTPSSSIQNGAFIITGDNINKISMVDRYNLGNRWEASIKIDLAVSNNANGEETVLKVGPFEAVLKNVKADKDTLQFLGFASVSLRYNGDYLGGYVFSTRHGTPDGYTSIDGVLKLSYNNGLIIMGYGAQNAESKAWAAYTGLDFSNTEISVSMDGNWMTNKITEFNLSVGASARANSNPNINGFNASEWVGDTNCIVKQSDGVMRFRGQASNTNLGKIIVSRQAYDLGNKWSVALNIQPSVTNTESRNESVHVVVGPIQMVFTNSSEGFPAELVLGEGDTVMRYNAPADCRYKFDDTVGSDRETNINGEMMMTYDNGMITVYYRGKQYIKKEMKNLDFSNVRVTVSVSSSSQAVPTVDSLRLKKGTLSHTPYVKYDPNTYKPAVEATQSNVIPVWSIPTQSKPTVQSNTQSAVSKNETVSNSTQADSSAQTSSVSENYYSPESEREQEATNNRLTVYIIIGIISGVLSIAGVTVLIINLNKKKNNE